jgi:hypothetical protein
MLFCFITYHYYLAGNYILQNLFTNSLNQLIFDNEHIQFYFSKNNFSGNRYHFGKQSTSRVEIDKLIRLIGNNYEIQNDEIKNDETTMSLLFHQPAAEDNIIHESFCYIVKTKHQCCNKLTCINQQPQMSNDYNELILHYSAHFYDVNNLYGNLLIQPQIDVNSM